LIDSNVDPVSNMVFHPTTRNVVRWRTSLAR